MLDPYEALYIHVPFCAKRCSYCDFSTHAAAPDSPELDAYTDDLIQSIRQASREGKLAHIKTVYLGGGTPSYLGNRRLSSILYMLSLSMHLTPEVECTLEANPDSLTEAMVKDLFALGVTRLSLGVQSFNDEHLRTLGRIHDADAARAAIRSAQVRFTNISIDLMCGLPGQTVRDFERDVAEAVSLGVAHVSVYPLTIEENTPFGKQLDEGTLNEPSNDLQADMMLSAQRILEAAGFSRYEVASYALPGFESRHNRAYWTGIPYLGLGPGAVSMTQDETMRMRTEGDTVIERLDRAQREAEDLMLGMRMSCGVSDGRIAAALPWVPDAPAAFAELIEQGYVEHRDGSMRPTQKGWLCGNALYGRLLDLAP